MTINKNTLKNKVIGQGFIEDFAVIECWKIRGFFSVGAYTHLANGSNIYNSIIGRFSRIDTNVIIGFRMAESALFSNHYLSYSEDGNQSNNSEYAKIKSKRFHFHKQPMCFIGNDVRIHKDSIICTGVKIGDGAIIYPNSVVTDDMPSYSICAGNPARVIGYRFKEDIIRKITKFNWTSLDISNLESDTNFADIDDIINQLETNDFPNKEYQCNYVNSSTEQINNVIFPKLLIGPSHVHLWQEKINSQVRHDPNFAMYGFFGMSLYDSKLKPVIDWYIKEKKGTVFLMVPDFRIGNSELSNHGISLDSSFVYGKIINKANDDILYQKALVILDNLVESYGSNIKFIFWCLMGRESLNIKNGNHVEDGVYRHPTWNYSELKERYKDSILEMGEVENKMDNYTLPNGTIHPNDEGYDLLEKYI